MQNNVSLLSQEKLKLILNLHPGCVFFLRTLKYFTGMSCCFSTSLWGMVINRYYFQMTNPSRAKWTVRVYKSWVPAVSLPVCIAVFPHLCFPPSVHIDWRQQKFKQTYLSPQYSQPQKINYNYQKHLLDILPLETHTLLLILPSSPNIFTDSRKEVSIPRGRSLFARLHSYCGGRRSPKGLQNYHLKHIVTAMSVCFENVNFGLSNWLISTPAVHSEIHAFHGCLQSMMEHSLIPKADLLLGDVLGHDG